MPVYSHFSTLGSCTNHDPRYTEDYRTSVRWIIRKCDNKIRVFVPLSELARWSKIYILINMQMAFDATNKAWYQVLETIRQDFDKDGGTGKSCKYGVSESNENEEPH